MPNKILFVAASVLTAVASGYLIHSGKPADCPAGTQMGDPVLRALMANSGLSLEKQREVRERYGAQTCLAIKHPESAAQMLAAGDVLGRRAGIVPDGAFRSAVEQKQAMEPLKAAVNGAGGTWKQYGDGNLIGGGGHENVGTRADSFAYDPVTQRLFAALGSGGIWMTQAQNGDVTTLADSWTAIDATLPTTIFSTVAWTPAGGGTLVVVGGEHMMGSGAYYGLGAFWSKDLGKTWTQSKGVPDQALAFRTVIDPAHPEIVYAATSKGLFRSTDAGRNFVNVKLPTSTNDGADCAGNEETSSACQYTNFVTDVAVKHPGGSTGFECASGGCPVLAAIGFREGSGGKFRNGTSKAPANGLYRSDTGEPGSFAKLDVSAVNTVSADGFAVQNRIARTELGVATGELQNHDYVYAIVQDAVLFNDGPQTIDAPDALFPLPAAPPLVPFATAFNGLYVSSDFGTSWTRMADTAEIADNPQSGTALGLNALLGYAPGIQSWYNQWVTVDPTRQDASGVPTRLSFGLEEVWQNKTPNQALDGASQSGPDDFRVFGGYGAPTHADQHTGVYIPTGDGGVCLFIGNDGGIAKQCVDADQEFDRTANGWDSEAKNFGIYATLPYGIAVSGDGTVWFGLQDNGSGYIDGTDKFIVAKLGGDGFYCETDPDNSNTAYCESQGAAMQVTTNRGSSWADIKPTRLAAQTGAAFDQWFTMDPTDKNHLITGGLEIFESVEGPDTTPDNWVSVFTLGLNPQTNQQRRHTTSDLLGEAAYVGWCGPCGVWSEVTDFQNGIATNVGGALPPKKAAADGWHIAGAQGLENRLITSIEIDPNDTNTIYATLAGYYSNIRPPNGYLEANPNAGSGHVFKSTDAGETFADISGNLPNVSVSNILYRNGQLLVGTDVGPFISTDTTGGQWAPLGKGLPSVPTTMLRLQPGNPNMLFAATFGRNVWTYEFTGAAAIKADEIGSGKQGKGLLLGALSPALLLLLGLGLAVRRKLR
ncbi:MAG: hypothetical protein AABY95_09880 [Pseudomonadota bacterium]